MTGHRTLVIGGAGYIGKYLLSLLRESGRAITVLGRNDIAINELPENVKFVTGDFGDAALIKKLLDQHDEVIHLAYATVPNTSYDNPLGDLLENLPATVRLFSEIALRNIKLLLVSSGGTVYGEADKVPMDETHPTRPISPYGVTKLTIENYARLYFATTGLNYIVVRPSNAYGVGQYPFKGQGFVSTAIASAMAGKNVLIFGKDGTIRDYVYVSDVATGILAALEKGRPSETYNIGTGVGLSNLEIILKAKSILDGKGHKFEVEHLPEREFDVKQNVLNAAKLTAHTGWNPKVDIEEGILQTYNWLKSLNG